MATNKKRKKRMILAACTIFIVLVLCVSMIVSVSKFGTVNFPKVIQALQAISNGESNYVEIKDSPSRIVLASPERSMEVFKAYLNENGYVIVEDEQLGAVFVIAKGEEREKVVFSVNGYYSLWRWIHNS